MSVPCRCRHCRARRSLKKHPNNYQVQPVCPICGQRHWAVDGHRFSGRELGRERCDCGELPFPHRHGSRGCLHGPVLDEQEYRDMINNLVRSHR